MGPARRDFLRLVGGTGSIVVAGCSLGGSDPTINVPTRELSDEPVSIRVTGLKAQTQVTIWSRTQSRSGTEWGASAVFETGPDGTLTVGDQRPVDGRYYDRPDPMGLFWAMRPTGADPTEPLPPRVWFFPPQEAFDVSLTVEADGKTLTEAMTTRLLYDPNITKVKNSPEDLVGTAFLPPGTEQAPGVILLHGAGGRPLRSIARQLASRGFATLALQYFGDPEPLPDTLREVPVEYVRRAVNWFRNHERVAGEGIGLFGSSRGGPLALLAATLSDHVGAVVGWCPSGIVYEGLGLSQVRAGTSAWAIDGESVPYLEMAEVDLGPPPTPELPLFEPPLENAPRDRLEAATIPVGEVDAPIYLVSVTDDQRWPSPRLSKRVINRLDSTNYPHTYRHDAFEDAGHSLFPPYLPTAGTMRNRVKILGGSPAANARANTAAWRRTRAFLASSLGGQ